MDLGTSELRRLDRCVLDAQARFNRVLVAWAGDVLELRRRGLLVPCWSESPLCAPSQGEAAIEPMNQSTKKAA
jgi:putative hemolysin